MSILQYATRVSPDGSITLPSIPEYQDLNVVVVVTAEKSAEKPLKGKRKDVWPSPTSEQLQKMYDDCRGCLEGTTREEYDQMKQEAIT